MNSKTKRAIRRRLYVDRQMQGRLIIRSIFFWYFHMSAILLVVGLAAALADPNSLAIKQLYRAFAYFAPGIIASVLLLPLFIFDMLKATNRIAGPIYRLRNEMKKLAAGQDVRPLRFRDRDDWVDLAEDFNMLAEAVMQERHERSPAEEFPV